MALQSKSALDPTQNMAHLKSANQPTDATQLSLMLQKADYSHPAIIKFFSDLRKQGSLTPTGLPSSSQQQSMNLRYSPNLSNPKQLSFSRCIPSTTTIPHGFCFVFDPLRTHSNQHKKGIAPVQNLERKTSWKGAHK